MSGIVGGIHTGSRTGLILDHVGKREAGIGKHNFLQGPRGLDRTTTTAGEKGYYQQNMLWEVVDSNIDEANTYYKPNGINLAVSAAYSGIRTQKKYRYFQLEADIRGFDGANHQGIFWHNTQPNDLESGSTTGYKSTHQNSSIYAIRGINVNSNLATFNPNYSSGDGITRHHMVWLHTNGTMYYFIDGVQKFASSSYAESFAGYCGFIAYAGTLQMSITNINLRSFD